MGVLPAVAAAAFRRSAHRIDIVEMAGLAFRGFVATLQRELGVPVVIEPDCLPCLGRMAGLAARAVCAVVDILKIMAARAFGRNAFVDFACMALVARDFLVCLDEFELGFAVIERRRLLPGVLVVAGVARLTQTSLMWVARLVAADALERRLAERFAGLVASFAGHRRMFALQLEVCLAMIERALVESGDIGFSALVLLVAVSALGFGSDGVLRVKPSCLVAIRCHLVMTVKTQAVLRLASEWRVTLFTCLLVLLVGLGERPGHDELLEHVLAGSLTGSNAQPDTDQGGQCPAHGNRPSVEVNGDNVHDGGDDQHHEQRQVKEMPQREQLVVDDEPGCIANSGKMLADFSLE